MPVSRLRHLYFLPGHTVALTCINVCMALSEERRFNAWCSGNARQFALSSGWSFANISSIALPLASVLAYFFVQDLEFCSIPLKAATANARPTICIWLGSNLHCHPRVLKVSEKLTNYTHKHVHKWKQMCSVLFASKYVGNHVHVFFRVACAKAENIYFPFFAIRSWIVGLQTNEHGFDLSVRHDAHEAPREPCSMFFSTSAM